MKNDYEVRGDVTAIFIRKRKGPDLEALIDTTDLEHVMEFPNRWFQWYSASTRTYYVHGHLPQKDGNRKMVFLHRWIMQPPKGLVVDHIHHDTLDNRRENLRVLKNGFNTQNHNPNREGIRYALGVDWCEEEQKFRARVRINGRQAYLRRFDTLEEAKRAVCLARALYMPYSEEALIINEFLKEKGIIAEDLKRPN